MAGPSEFSKPPPILLLFLNGAAVISCVACHVLEVLPRPLSTLVGLGACLHFTDKGGPRLLKQGTSIWCQESHADGSSWPTRARKTKSTFPTTHIPLRCRPPANNPSSHAPTHHSICSIKNSFRSLLLGAHHHSGEGGSALYLRCGRFLLGVKNRNPHVLLDHRSVTRAVG